MLKYFILFLMQINTFSQTKIGPQELSQPFVIVSSNTKQQALIIDNDYDISNGYNFVISTTGNVGIGVSQPKSMLDINVNPNQKYALTIDTNNNPSDGYLVEIDTFHPVYFPRAIAVFDATTNPPTILYSKNISSISKPATGVFTICMQYPAPTTNYAIMGIVSGPSSDVSLRGIQLDGNYTRTNTCFQIWEKAVNPNSQANEDPSYVSVLVFY